MMTDSALGRCVAVALALGVALPAMGQGTANAPVIQEQETDPRAAAEIVIDGLQLGRLAELMAQDVAAAGDPLAVEGALTGPDSGWNRIAAQTASASTILSRLRQALAREVIDLPLDQRARIDAALAFWRAPLGQRVLGLDYAAREALIDPEVEQLALSAFADAAAQDDPRIAQVRRLIEAADMIDPAVAAALNTSIAMMRGLRDGGAVDMTDGEIAARVTALEPQISADHSGWIEAALFMSAAQLSGPEMEQVIRDAETPDARLLSDLVSRGLDDTLIKTAYDVGRAAARRAR